MDHSYSIQEVATKLNLSDKTLRRWEEAGKFTPSRTLGNQRRYTIEDIQILDAIKHGTINAQSELLSLDQAANFCGVSKVTFARWEDEGKIHPLITSGNTYYPRLRLETKMANLRSSMVEQIEDVPPQPASDPVLTPPPTIKPQSFKPAITLPTQKPPSPPLTSSDSTNNQALGSTLTHTLITLLLLLGYHLIFNSPSTPISPQTPGSVQGTTTVAPSPDPRLDDLIAKFKEHVNQQNLFNAKPITPTTINLDNTAYITSSYVLPAGKDQVSVTSDKVTPSTPVTISFSMDYSPAKKYWVTTQDGGFTLHTDFPVAADTTFNYSYLATINPTTAPTIPTPISTPSATNITH